jgi:NAD(P)-dependent dehydrogenase (short-subunit alcohol dehydrogenase family)
MTHGLLHGNVALITGGGSGLGAAFARRLAADGARVMVTDLNAAAAAEVAREIGGESLEVDVVDSGAVEAAVDHTVSVCGGLDIMINNAGIAPPFNPERFQRTITNEILRMSGDLAAMEPLEVLTEMSDADWDQMIRVHLYGVFHGCRAALRHFQPRRSGVIVNISSVLGLRPSSSAPHYSVAKAGIIALTKAVAEEVAPFGIRVNAVCPGWVDTPLLSDFDEQARQIIRNRVPMGRLATAEELAELVRFLSGPESSYCTGEVHSAGGGYA